MCLPTGGEWAARFTSQEVVTNLGTIYTSTRAENLRSTAASALSRLLRHSPAFLQVTGLPLVTTEVYAPSLTSH